MFCSLFALRFIFFVSDSDGQLKSSSDMKAEAVRARVRT